VLASTLAVWSVLWLFFRDKLRPAQELVLKAPVDIPGGLLRVWPLFGWGVLLTAVLGLFAVIWDVPRQLPPAVVLRRGIWLSINAGVFEELIFRLVMFVNAVAGLLFLNLITFGLVGWIYHTVLIPVADWTTFRLLHSQLHQASWAIGAAVLSVNGAFRDRHSHLGPFGYINSWFVGMVMFYLVFNYGLITAMIGHAVYDILIMIVLSIVRAFQRPATDPRYDDWDDY
jgi:hypothetical protein